MNFSEWEPVYEAILGDLHFDRDGDERSRDELCSYVEGACLTLEQITGVRGTTVAIVGAAATLETELWQVRESDVVFAASTAADVLLEAGLSTDLLVTDLDKNPSTVRTFTYTGRPVAIHAHGDNRPMIRSWVPRLDLRFVLPTTQAEPTGPIVNVGGFTDGDRAAFIADHLGADRLCFPGWDFDDPTVDARKREKLRWAERLLYWLERRRNEQFSVLDGRRQSIDTTPLPID